MEAGIFPKESQKKKAPMMGTFVGFGKFRSISISQLGKSGLF